MLILSISVFNIPSFAQTSDSTALPWTAAGPATFEPTPQPGTRCGSAAYDVRFNGHPEWGPVDGTGTIQTWVACQGHNPYYSCPSGYYKAPAGESGEGLYFFTCLKS